MPEAVMFSHLGKTHTVYFARAQAMLPVRLASGEVRLAMWGRRQYENSEMPLGGWARLESIHGGKWGQYLPRPVHLPIIKFMKTDYEGKVHWYDMVKGQYVQGVLARCENEFRVYIVTIVPELLDVCHDRWPRIIARPPVGH